MNRNKAYLLLLQVFLVQGIFAQVVNKLYPGAGIFELPYDRLIKPAGQVIIFGDSLLESHAMDCALSPGGEWLAVQERYSIVIIDTRTNKLAATLKLDSISGLGDAMSVYSGIKWFRDKEKDFVFFSASGGWGNSYISVLEWKNNRLVPTKLLVYPALPPASLSLANEFLIRNENGKNYLYIVLNGNNQIVKQDLLTGNRLWTKNTGVAPYGIAEAAGKIYVTNWAGRLPESGDKHVAGVPWGLARIDTSNAATREGSISVFDPVTGNVLKEIITGLHPNEIISSTDGRFVYFTNSNSDDVRVITTEKDEVTEIISLRLQKETNPFFGDSPEGLALSSDGKTLYVANGMDNAIGIIELGSKASAGCGKENSCVLGFVPVASYPSSISLLNDKVMYVTNLESFGANRAFLSDQLDAPAFNSHHMLTSVSVVQIPRKKQLDDYTKEVIALNQLGRLNSLNLPPRKDVSPKPVPERIGEPSVFKHVLYIIKENRTYDQVLGDMPEGKGDSSLCIYGEKVTPNTHKLAREFQLMDNFLVSGKCSAEGHQWTDASIVTDYVEKNVRAWFRSYPHVQEDALVYAPSGFLWDNARRNGVSVRIYGEASVPVFPDSVRWTDVYKGFLRGEDFVFKNETTLNTVAGILSPTYPAYDSHRIPDILRAKTFIDELHEYEKMEGDQMPKLMIMALPNDHTAGSAPGFPTPRAMIADNDLALGQIIEALTKSRFWENTVVFVVEDDSQAGWDHVSAYRTTAMVISPWSRQYKTVSEPYNQPSMVRTIEQILGMSPMNIQDAIAIPMTACFSEVKVMDRFTAVANQVPLDEMNPPLTALEGRSLYYAKQSMDPRFEHIDSGNDDVFNRILWFLAKGEMKYPAWFSGKTGEEESED